MKIALSLYILALLHISLSSKSNSKTKKSDKEIPVMYGVDDIPSEMPTEHSQHIKDQYEKFMADRKKNKDAQAKEKQRQQQQQQQQTYQAPPKGISPRKLGLVRDSSQVALTDQVEIKGGDFWFGSELAIKGKIAPSESKDGASPKKKASVKSFSIDIHPVTNRQFKEFVAATNYKTEAELYEWSFVFEGQASPETIAQVDGETGFGRVKEALHWMAVANASWFHPYGLDSTIEGEYLDYPVIQVSYLDAVEYCAWGSGGLPSNVGGLRLPTEKEWEYAARGGTNNQSYPWGKEFIPGMMNIWEGAFPKSNDLTDGYLGLAPAVHYEPNGYGLYNMLGNTWEWVSGGTKTERILRGGSFIDSFDGSFNHMVIVSTRQTNAADSAGSNIGFRCARTIINSDSTEL